jgi:hypothetical protein
VTFLKQYKHTKYKELLRSQTKNISGHKGPLSRKKQKSLANACEQLSHSKFVCDIIYQSATPVTYKRWHDILKFKLTHLQFTQIIDWTILNWHFKVNVY